MFTFSTLAVVSSALMDSDGMSHAERFRRKACSGGFSKICIIHAALHIYNVIRTLVHTSKHSLHRFLR